MANPYTDRDKYAPSDSQILRLLLDKSKTITHEFDATTNPSSGSDHVFSYCFCLNEEQEALFQFILAIPFMDQFFHFDETASINLWRQIMESPCTPTVYQSAVSDANSLDTSGKPFDLVSSQVVNPDGSTTNVVTLLYPAWVDSFFPPKQVFKTVITDASPNTDGLDVEIVPDTSESGTV